MAALTGPLAIAKKPAWSIFHPAYCEARQAAIGAAVCTTTAGHGWSGQEPSQAASS